MIGFVAALAALGTIVCATPWIIFRPQLRAARLDMSALISAIPTTLPSRAADLRPAPAP